MQTLGRTRRTPGANAHEGGGTRGSLSQAPEADRAETGARLIGDAWKDRVYWRVVRRTDGGEARSAGASLLRSRGFVTLSNLQRSRKMTSHSSRSLSGSPSYMHSRGRAGVARGAKRPHCGQRISSPGSSRLVVIRAAYRAAGTAAVRGHLADNSS